jgi:hypothetical protein
MIVSEIRKGPGKYDANFRIWTLEVARPTSETPPVSQGAMSRIADFV